MARPTDSGTAIPPVVIRGRDGLLGAVPGVLGFHPTESAVLMCLTGPTLRLGPVVRADLPAVADPGVATDVVVQLVGASRRYADQVVVVVYTDHPGAVDLDAMWDTVEGLGMSVRDVMCVSNAPWQVAEELLAANAFLGRAVLPSRAEVAQSIEHQPGFTAPDVVTSALRDVAGRDALITWLMPQPEAVAVLVTAAQGTPDSARWAADLCAVLAVCAYRRGDGALAQAAASRAVRCRPAHRLAHLMLWAMAAAIHPSELDVLITQ